MASLEREIVLELRTFLQNPKLRKKDLLEWTTGEPSCGDGEIIVVLPTFKVKCVVEKKHDKRV